MLRQSLLCALLLLALCANVASSKRSKNKKRKVKKGNKGSAPEFDLAGLFAGGGGGFGGGGGGDGGGSKGNQAKEPEEPMCQEECKRLNCDDTNIKYGRYCGVGYGCSHHEFEPCDVYDACCEVHDLCVTEKNMMDTGCHDALAKCLDEAHKAEEIGFAERDGLDLSVCPVETAVKTMKSGMQLASLFGSLFSGMGQAADRMQPDPNSDFKMTAGGPRKKRVKNSEL